MRYGAFSRQLFASWVLGMACAGLSFAQTFNETVEQYHAGEIAQAVANFHLLASQENDPDAQYVVASLLEKGEHVQRNVDHALLWYERSANQGNPFAQTALAAYLIAGEHVMPDYSRALELFLKAAEKGHAPAQYNAALMLQTGMGLEQPDLKKSYDLFDRAARAGHLRAQLTLVDSLLTTQAGKVEAYGWLLAAKYALDHGVALGVLDAQKDSENVHARLSELASTLTPTQVTQAQQFAKKNSMALLVISAQPITISSPIFKLPSQASDEQTQPAQGAELPQASGVETTELSPPGDSTTP